jgi:hypothetical protein
MAILHDRAWEKVILNQAAIINNLGIVQTNIQGQSS